MFRFGYRTFTAKQEQQIDQQNKMSITINFGSAPEEIHWFGDVAPEIWDIIYTFKEDAELRDAAEIPDWWIAKICRMMSKDMKAFCRTHKIQQHWSWVGSREIERDQFFNKHGRGAWSDLNAPHQNNVFDPSTRLGMAVNILFQLILKKNPQPFHPKHWLKEDLQWGWYSGSNGGAITYRVGVRCAEPISGLSLFNQITKYIHDTSGVSGVPGMRVYVDYHFRNQWAGKYTRLDRNTKWDLIERQRQIRNFLQAGPAMSSALEKKIADLTPKANVVHHVAALADPKPHFTDPN